MTSTTAAVDRRQLPLVLLDVDGVLNAIHHKPDRSVWPDWQSGTATADGEDFPILWSPTVVATVADWHTSGLAEVRWLTTWRRDANRSLRQLIGTPAFKVEGELDYEATTLAGEAAGLVAPSHGHAAGAHATNPLTGRWWKADCVFRIVADNPGRKILWIDDDLYLEPAVCRWMTANAHAELIAPRPRYGLTRRHLRAASAFLADPSRDASASDEASGPAAPAS